MKNHFIVWRKRLVFSLFSLLMAVQAFAQDKGLDINVEIGTEPVWYKQTWVWVVGAAVFVLALVALLRKRR